MKMIMRVNCLW